MFSSENKCCVRITNTINNQARTANNSNKIFTSFLLKLIFTPGLLTPLRIRQESATTVTKFYFILIKGDFYTRITNII